MTQRRAYRVRLLLRIALVLTCVQYAVATVGVQLFEMPVRTDFASYYLAGQLTVQNANPYDAAALADAGHAIGFDYDQYPFLYPPVFALAMQPLSQISFATARQIWMLLSTLWLAVALIVTARSVRLLARQLAIQQELFAWLVLVPFVIMVLHSTAVHNDVRSGSVGSMLWMCLILVLYNTQQRRAAAAGFWLAVATCIKLVPLVLLPWLAWRCGRRAAIWTMATLGVSILLALLHWGPFILASYIRDALWPASHLSSPWAHNVSLDAAWLRVWQPLTENLGIGALGGMGRLLVLLSGLLIVAITLRALWRRAWSARRLPLEFSVATLVILLTMRITWVHSLTPMLFVWPFLMCWGAAGLEHGKRWCVPVILVGCFGFFLAVAHLPTLWGERWLTWPWLLAPGLHTLGLLLLWGVSIFLLGQQTTSQRKPTTPRVT